MRRRLWLQLHLWTIGLVAVLTIANVASALRPYSAARTGASGGLVIGQDGPELSGRSPASHTADGITISDPRLALKTARVGCEPKSRLKVVTDVRQLRLQFEPCTAADLIVGIQNKTNGFEATVFGLPSTDTEPEAMAGTFTTPEDTKAAKVKRMIASENTPPASAAKEDVSTDYIALAPGENEITIHRSNREQTLRIERK